MVLNMLYGLYPDFVGRRAIFVGNGTGPSSYTTGGDTVTLNLPNYYIDALSGDVLTVSGTYFVRPIPSAIGPRAIWKLVWYYATGGSINTQVSSAVDLSAEQLQIGGFCGQF
jgi:hypothetical protein